MAGEPAPRAARPPRRPRVTPPVLLALAAAAAAALLAVLWALMIRMPGRSHAGALAPLTAAEEESRARLAAHVTELAGRIGERSYRRPVALAAAATYVETELAALGYEVASQPFAAGGQTFRNLEATRPGRGRADEVVVVGAHYDAVVGTPGADDNASGTAAVLELARLLRDAPLERTVRFVAFVNEEPPFFLTEHMGSRVYARAAARRGDRVVAMLSLETIGYYSDAPKSQRYPPPLGALYPSRGDFIGFVGDVASRALVRRSVAAFRRHARFPSEGVAAPSWVPGVFWSDHSSFWREGYPALMITDTAPFRNPAYHSAADTPDRVDYPRMARVVHGVAAVVRELAGAGDGPG
jgi:Zn-dependent M28 family amino/carboxypeptidase